MPDSELRALAFRHNRDHGVRVTTGERDRLIVDLYLKDGKTPAEIGPIVERDEKTVYRTLASRGVRIAKGKLTDEQKRAIVRLLLKGEKQKDIANTFGISEGRVTQLKTEFWDSAKSSYEGGAMKREVAASLGLEPPEVDAMLRAAERREDVQVLEPGDPHREPPVLGGFRTTDSLRFEPWFRGVLNPPLTAIRT